MKRLLFILITSASLMSCAQNDSDQSVTKNEESVKDLNSLQTAYFASGCFWCVEAVFESVKGVEEVISGYAGGSEKNPTYVNVSRGNTSHAEAVKVYYDSTQVSFSTLVDVFFNSHDPTTLNQQGPDRGTQYRSIAFYENEAEKEIILLKIKEFLQVKTFDVITTEVKTLDVFWDAEDYHQDYERLHPNESYVKSVSIPRLNAFKQKMPEVLK